MEPAAPHQRPPAERLEAAACLGWLGRLLALALLAVAPTGVPTTTLTELPSASAFEAQAKLIPKLRQLYGGSGAVRGLVPILAVIRPRLLQMLGLIRGIIQLALGIGLLFTALEVQALAIQELLR